ncbi:MAG: Sec-dependent nitrous-oxide reductase [Flavobacteriaceae bacterium]
MNSLQKLFKNPVFLLLFWGVLVVLLVTTLVNQTTSSEGGLISGDVPSKVYVEPGQHDDFYGFFSGGFSGQVSVYGLPSGRQLKVIPVFSVDAEKGYGFNEETKPLLNTSYGFIPWDDSHHPHLSQTEGIHDGKWLFINGNNTPRIARIDLTTFETAEILEVPNSAGNHCSAFVTENTEYVVASTRFSVPIPQRDVPIDSYKETFKGAISFVSVDDTSGDMDLAFQVMVPGFGYDLARGGKGKSHGWVFFTSYNSEESHSLLEVNASQHDKDYILALNWKKMEEYIAQGKFEDFPATYFDNEYSEHTHMATSTQKNGVKMLYPKDLPGIAYLIPTPKSPHGVDIDPSGEYIVGNGKLSADMTVHSFDKIIAAIDNEDFTGEIQNIPVINFESVVHGTLEQAGLGPLHTEFDDEGNAYTSYFISSEVVKWKLGSYEVIDRQPTYYSVGHILVPGGTTRKPWGKYLVAMNKITKDRYLPTGPELNHSAQLYDISGEKMELLLDFPTIGEPHYAQAIPADLVAPNSKRIYALEDNHHPYAVKSQFEGRVERSGKEVHVYMNSIRSHFYPDNIEGIRVGDRVYIHLTNLEQDWDVPHGLGVLGAQNAELLVMPGQTETLVWEPKSVGIYPFYCTDFCSALHQEMSGYIRVSAADANTKLRWSLDDEWVE